MIFKPSLFSPSSANANTYASSMRPFVPDCGLRDEMAYYFKKGAACEDKRQGRSALATSISLPILVSEVFPLKTYETSREEAW